MAKKSEIAQAELTKAPTVAAAARRARPHRRIRHPARHRARGPARQHHRRQGRDARHRRRIRLRQIGHLLRGDAHSRPRRHASPKARCMFSGLDLRAAPESEMRDLRGREMSMIFQIAARWRSIRSARSAARSRTCCCSTPRSTALRSASEAIEMLEQVRIARPRERYHAYPFELSGGMCQRVVIALALACRPQLLIADEPTTGLDVTTQKAVMDLVVELTRERGMSTILITHDLGLAAAYCDRVVVMEKGRVVETAKSDTIFKKPAHAYTRKLMRATPRPGVSLRDLLPEDEAGARRDRSKRRQASRALPARTPLLVVEKLVKEYPRKGLPSFVRQDVRPQAAGGDRDVPRRRRHQLFHRARRKRRPGRRIRLRQIHHLDDGDAADRQDLRPDHVRRRRHRRNSGAQFRHAAVAQAHPDGVSGPDRQPQPALHRRARHRRSAAAAWRDLRRGEVRARCEELADASRPAARICSTVSRISFPADRRRASASRAPSRSSPTSSSSTSRPPRSTCRSRPSSLTCCRT